ncbi:hypothetical protein DMW20_11905 [Vibrio parahaemolyticus]|nr:hypothetical protein [Vibrio parahaemolyticus]
MTTTVCDLVNQIITADTRWSCEINYEDGRRALVYSDDTGFDKISILGHFALVMAGDGRLIAEWKSWWLAGAKDKQPETEKDGKNKVNIAIIDMKKNAPIFDAGQKQVLYCVHSNEIKAFTSGSGGPFAAADLLENGCAKKAIRHASNNDYYTSDVVSFACYKSGENNLKQITDYQEIVNGILDRGYIMQLQTTKPSDQGIKLCDHPDRDAIATLFAEGKAVASAPVPGIGAFEWTADTKSKFEAAISEVHASLEATA